MSTVNRIEEIRERVKAATLLNGVGNYVTGAAFTYAATGMLPTMGDLLADIEYLLSWVPRWIPVTERLPDEGQPCVVWFPDRSEFSEMRYGAGHGLGSLSMALFSGGRFAWPSWTPENSRELTHWMPLPGPPESTSKPSPAEDTGNSPALESGP